MLKQIVVFGAVVSMGALALPACGTSDTGVEQTGEAEQEVIQACGGFANLPCPAGYTCVDDPSDGCDPNNGGADCGGYCRKPNKCQNPARQYVSHSPATCQLVKFFCAPGLVFFSDECGCGCEPPTAAPCGNNFCGNGEYCCNESCGICAPLNGFCTQQACLPT